MIYFYADSTRFHIIIDQAVLKQSLTDLTSNYLTIFAYSEIPRATIASDAALTERTLNSRYLILDLFEEEFLDYSSLDTGDFTLNNFPEGLAIEAVTGIWPTSVRTVSYTHLTLPTTLPRCRSRWSPYH